MINFLKDVSVDTFIGELPSILNFNNRQVSKEFDNLFDTSSNTLKQSVYAPNGSVKAHWGRFQNLYCDFFSVGNIDSFKNVMSQIPHNYFSKRFAKDLVNEDGTIDYAHDLQSIESGLGDGESLAGRLARLDASVRRLYYYLTLKNGTVVHQASTKESSTGMPDYIDPSAWSTIDLSSGLAADASYQKYVEEHLQSDTNSGIVYYNTDEDGTKIYDNNNVIGDNVSVMNEVLDPKSEVVASAKAKAYSVDQDYINAIDSSTSSYQYQKSIFTVPSSSIKTIVRKKCEASDVKSGELYTYYDATTSALKISNERTNVIYAKEEGQVVTLILNKIEENKDFVVKLSKKSALQFNYGSLTKIKLIAIKIEDQFTSWDVYEYSAQDSTLKIIDL